MGTYLSRVTEELVDRKGEALRQLPLYYKHTQNHIPLINAEYHELPGFEAREGSAFRYWGDRILVMDETGVPLGYLPRCEGPGKPIFYRFEVRKRDSVLGIPPYGIPPTVRKPFTKKRDIPGVEILDQRAYASKLLANKKVWLDHKFKDGPEGTIFLSFTREKSAGGDPHLAFCAPIEADAQVWPTYHFLTTLRATEDHFDRLHDGSYMRPVPHDATVIRGSRPSGGAIDLEPPFAELEIDGRRGWASGDLLSVDPKGTWRLTPLGQKLGLEKIWAVLPTRLTASPFHSTTSKMGCASWSLPAGPTGAARGTCHASAPMPLSEWREPSGPNDREGNIRFTKAAYRKRLDAQGKVFDSVGQLGPGANTEEPADGDMEYRPRRPRFTCSNCYAMKGDYASMSVQFAQQARFLWTQEAMKHDRVGKELPKDLSPEDHGERSFFAYAMAEAIKVYYARSQQPARRAAGEDPRFYRIHDSGDFYDLAYLWAWIFVARQLPKVRFWAPTRQWVWGGEWEKAMLAAPENLVLRPSALQLDELPPKLSGYAGGTTVTTKTLDLWNCPAGRSGRGSCTGGLVSVSHSEPQWRAFSPSLPSREVSCRLCWGGHPVREGDPIKADRAAILRQASIGYPRSQT